MPSRRALLSIAVCSLGLGPAWSLFAPPAFSGEASEQRRHALSLIGEPRYPANFDHFDWIDASAPKGGEARLRSLGTYDTLNRYTAKGLRADGLHLVDATLMASSLDEPSTEYGLIAEWVSHPPDFSSATFGLRPEARFSDGTPVTADDVVFTLDAVKKANPRFALYFKNVVRAEKLGSHEVRFVFDAPENRELPLIVSTMPVLPKHYWTGKDDKGEPRDLGRGSLEIPVGAGPYRVVGSDTGRKLVLERVKDWWAKDLPVSRGQYNFDRLVYQYYRDRVPAFEGFKVAETDFWPENSAKGWATEFDFDAVKRGLVKREELPDGNIPPMQGFAFNLRRPQFADRRVREAFNLAFNFEWANSNMFFGQYK
ncbi:MAG: ABC transporter substrate-binding protein, partial [Proteobacteria bacterium]|nr:ABC transporter substrate-binding protein [Pseudomonadota bacterium]